MFVHHGSLVVAARSNAAYEAAKKYLIRDPLERSIFCKLEHEPATVHLRTNAHNDDSYDAQRRTIHWDPYSALRTRQDGHQSPALGLGHEADHATVAANVLINGWSHPIREYDNAEERRVICGSEAHAARTLGESRRYDHDGRCYRVAGPLKR